MSNIFASAFIVLTIVTHIRAGDYGPRCEDYAEAKKCGKLCEPTCEKPEQKWCPPECEDDCKIECRCEDGYVRHNGRCIKAAECPKPKPPPKCSCDEELSLCGSICEPSCINPHPKLCPKLACSKFTEGCRCKKGYLRDPLTKKCIPSKECKKCEINERRGPCGRKCEATCENRKLGKCDLAKCKDSDCQCKKGFHRNEKTNKCVPVGECPKKCEYGETYAACGRTCEGTCKSPFEPKYCQLKKCLAPGCRCDLKAGFVRNEISRKCVRIKDCKEPCKSDDDDEKYTDKKRPHHDVGIGKYKDKKRPHYDVGIDKYKQQKRPHHDVGIDKYKHQKRPHHDGGKNKQKHEKRPHHGGGKNKYKDHKRPKYDDGDDKYKDDDERPHYNDDKDEHKNSKHRHDDDDNDGGDGGEDDDKYED